MTDIVTPATPKAGAAFALGASAESGLRRSDALKGAAKQFEAVFLRQMIGAMRSATPGEDLFGSQASAQFRDMSDARLADTMAGGFGIAALVERQLKGTQ